MTISLLRHWESVEDAINAVAVLGGHWPLTETSGTKIYDTSGYGRHGTLSGTVTLNNTTAPDGRPAALFGGGHIEVPDDASYSIEASLGFTVGCLAKFNAIPAARIFLMTKGGLSSNNYEWSLNGSGGGGTDGLFGFTVHTAPGATISARTSNTANAVNTAWTLLIARVQDRAVSSRIDLYKDNSTPISGTDATTGSGYTDGPTPLRIGARYDGAASPMAGYIRHAFVCNEAINPASVERIVLACKREGWGF